jgi:hypothetical protein
MERFRQCNAQPRGSWLLILSILMMAAAIVCYGQAVFGVIRGSVADSSGLPIAGVKVTALNQNTRELRSTTTDTQGDFVFPALIPGSYTVAVEVSGFKKYEKRDAVLTAQGHLDIGRLTLTVGQVTETVQVTAPATPVQTASAERSSTITAKQAAELPVLSRNISHYLLLIPGAVSQSGQGTDSASSQTDPLVPLPNVGAVPAFLSNFSVDGINNVEDGTAGWVNSHVNPDAVGEVKVLSNNYSAEYGRNAGAVVNAVTKSGTQSFHGMAYTYWRHEQFNSGAFFDNQSGVAKARDRYHMYGGNIGGPIYWPGKFNRNKDKLFFFVSEEGTWLNSSQTSRYTMPTALERSGDFSQTLDTSNKTPVITDPSTGSPFPGNVIPSGRIDPNMQKMMNVFPQPNYFNRAISGGSYNYITPIQPVHTTRPETIVRLDYNVNDRLRLYFRGNRYQNYIHYPWGVGPPAWANLVETDQYKTSGGVLSASYTFSPTLVNEVSFGAKGHHRYSADWDMSTLQSLTRTKLGVTIPQFHPEINPYNLIPGMSFSGVTGSASMSWDGRFPLIAMYQDYSFIDSLTKVYRGHTIKAGVDFEAIYTKNGDNGTFAGTFAFTQSTTNPLDSGWAYSNGLLGNFYSYSESTSRPRQFDYARSFEWYIQDTWKATPRLTLDYGMRFSYRWPDWNPTGLAASFDPRRFDPSQTVTLYQPAFDSAGKRVALNPLTGAYSPAVLIGAIVPNAGNVTNGMVSGTDSSYPRGFMQQQGIQFGPRFGFAYDLNGNGKTAIRGGFGLTSFSGEDSIMRNLALNPPTQYTPIIYYSTVSTFMNAGSNLFPSSVTGVAASGESPSYYNYSIGVQRAIGFDTVLDIAYVGTLGRHLWMYQNLNTLPYGARFLSSSIDPTTGKALADTFLAPYRGYSSVTVRQNGGTSNYNSLQMQAHRRFTAGMQMDFVWTWSKALDYGMSGYNLGNDASTNMPVYMPRRWNYGLSNLDHTHNVKIAWVWDVPLLTKLWKNRLAWAVGDGWQLAGIATFLSGTPARIGFSLADGADLTGGGDGQRIMQSGNAVLAKSDRTFYRYFDTSVFARPALGSVGTAPLISYRGPGINNWDMSLKRDFSVKDKAKLEFRMDATNAFNHTQFNGVDSTARFDASGNQISQTFGRINGARAPRRMQAALRFIF